MHSISTGLQPPYFNATPLVECNPIPIAWNTPQHLQDFPHSTPSHTKGGGGGRGSSPSQR